MLKKLGITAGVVVIIAAISLAIHFSSNTRKQPTEEKPTLSPEQTSIQDSAPPKSNETDAVIHQPRKFKEIYKSGVLRVLSIRSDELTGLPRSESPTQRELRMLKGFAEWLKLKMEVIWLDDFDQLIPELLNGRGDIIAASMTITDIRRRKISFSKPINHTREHLVTSTSTQFAGLPDISGQTIVIERGTTYWDSVNKLRKKFPDIKIISSTDDTEELLYQAGIGKIKYTVSDELFLENYNKYRQDIKSVYTFPDQRYIAFGMNKGTLSLQKLLNTFIERELKIYSRKRYTDDLPGLKKRNILRVITRDNPINYFISRGTLMGFEYELAKKFAEENNMELSMVVAPSWKTMQPWLIEGCGDIIASSMSYIPSRTYDKNISMCYPYTYIREVIVTRKNDNSIKSAKDLENRTFAVRMSSSYWQTLKQLREMGIKFKTRAVPEDIESYEILNGIAKGKYDITLVDDVIYNIKKQSTNNIKTVFSVGKPKRYSWIVRSSNPKLRLAINNFFKKIIHTDFYKKLYQKYCLPSKISKENISKANEQKQFIISKYDRIVKKYARDRNMNWCMVSSQIFHESTFDPKAESSVGAKGLMQLMPFTAKEMGCTNPFHPEQNVKAGTGYLAKLRKRFSGNSSLQNKTCFALAGYNGGIGHVYDARKIAAESGLNPNVWKGNVEVGMKKLAERKYASRARYGFCRGDMISKYVNDILTTNRKFEQQATEKSNTIPGPAESINSQ